MRIPLLLAALAAALVPAFAHAHDNHESHDAPAPRLVVVRDAQTGLLRAATAEEAAALNAQGPKAPALATRGDLSRLPLAKVHANGARGVRLTDDMASYAVAVRRADGSLALQCVHGQAATDAAASSAPASAAVHQ